MSYTPIDSTQDKVLAVVLLLAMLAFFGMAMYHISHFALAVVTHVEEARATAECLKWEDQAKMLPNFYLTEAEQAQCDYYNIQVFNEEAR